MSSKSMSDRSAPHQGMGRFSKCLSAFRRYLRIQSGSFLSAEISSTTAALSPRLGVNTEFDRSCQPNRYPLDSSSRCSCCVTTMRGPLILFDGGFASSLHGEVYLRDRNCPEPSTPTSTGPANGSIHGAQIVAA